MESPATHHHWGTLALGIYKGQAFVTGSHSGTGVPTGNVKTEILEETKNMGFVSKQWNVVADNPFSRDDR